MERENTEMSGGLKRILVILASLTIPFIVLVYGTCGIYLDNSEEFLFRLSDFWGWLVLIGIVVFALIATLLFFLRGKVFHVVLSVIIWLSVMLYIQDNFLNGGFGSLQADGLAPSPSVGMIVGNLFIWLVTGAAFICIAVFVKDKQLLGSLSIIAVVMILTVQTINLTVGFVNNGAQEFQKNDMILTDENLFEVSEKDNVIVFVLDRFDYYYYEQIVKKDPVFFDKLDGFTFYNNNISLYSRTYPSIAYMLTGVENSFTDTRPEYFKEAYGTSSFFRDLKANNYKINLFSEAFYAYEDASVFDGLVDNVSRYNDYRIENKPGLIGSMFRLSMYRYLPLAFKGMLQISSSDFSEFVSHDTENKLYVTNDAETYRKFRESGLSVQAQKNTFTFLHLNGCHSPFTMDEEGNPIESSNYESAAYPAIRGCFHMIYEYIDQLKTLGLYKNSTIIITGDHARAMDDWTDVEGARVTALFVKERGCEGTPLSYSSAPVCQENLRAEIIKSAGIKTEKSYGTAFSEISEDAQITRKYYFQKSSKKSDEIVVYHVVGDAKNFSNWKLADRIQIGEIYR